jgi:hypothetical protein
MKLHWRQTKTKEELEEINKKISVSSVGKEGTRTGVVLSASTKKKMSRSHQGVLKSEEHKRKISRSVRRAWADPKIRSKIQESQQGLHFTKEHKEAISRAMLKK